jgi:hypothetical protein
MWDVGSIHRADALESPQSDLSLGVAGPYAACGRLGKKDRVLNPKDSRQSRAEVSGHNSEAHLPK